MNIDDFISRLDKPKRTGQNQWMACCPAHNDSKPSLAVSVAEDGKILCNCMAGCKAEDVISAMGLKMSDLFQEKKQNGRNNKMKYLREHIYTDKDGKPIAKKKIYMLPHGDKTASWYRFENGTYKKKLNNMQMPLYRLQELLKGADPVFIPEGEKDADTVALMGLTATTTPSGAGSKWNPSWNEPLKDKHVIILTDNDEPGAEHGKIVAEGLRSVAKSIQIVPAADIWPDVPPKGDISDIAAQFGIDIAKEKLLEAVAAVEPEAAPKARAKVASEFGDDNTQFLWYPYIPIGDYTVLMADGGTGKTIFCCGVAAAVSGGMALPGDFVKCKPERVLFISAEDRGEMLKKRLVNSGANLDNILIIDCQDSEGMNFTDNMDEFEAEVKRSGARLVVIDPWHAFIGEDTDISRVNCVRPVFQKLANMSKRCNCALVLISHVNKRAQGENANNAATGSTDFINASRSAMRIIFDEGDEDSRICVHTKTNYAQYGQSVKYTIIDGGLKWAGYSPITRETLEEAARKRTTAFGICQQKEHADAANAELIDAIRNEAPDCYTDGTLKLSYDDMKSKYGNEIFGGMQPKRALDSVAGKLLELYHIAITTGVHIKRDGKQANGFYIQLSPADEAAV
jgi:5S rRNA maturation endonuclease (ribonuclease M5)